MNAIHVPGTMRHPWLGLLRHVGPTAIERVYGDDPEHLSAEVSSQNWLGSPGVAEPEIVRHEQRLGARLPPSYREFLQVTNGWDKDGIACGQLLPLAEIGWLRDLDPHLAGMWSSPDEKLLSVPDEDYFVYGEGQDTVHLRAEYLPDTLQIGEYDDGTYLLNPHIKTPDGEWEAWYLAPWLPGAMRFRSFWDLMNGRLREYTEAP
ncbi:SMI1/KNR4 family protein [Streptosporangium sp. NPDC023963]|uniref:SMI1/KNR4 family protein n=1 Tax=Streptosporangium sp. NPDC023963 TaxID=3155608 RepID=UPI00342A9681